MAYQARRNKQFQEDFELCDEVGNVVETIHVKIDTDSMLKKIHHKYTDLCKTLASARDIKQSVEEKDPDKIEVAMEHLGNGVINLLQAVFGETDAEKIVRFYEGNYAEMCKEVVPFITNVVIPRCREIKKENMESILQRYNRQQRRKLFGK